MTNEDPSLATLEANPELVQEMLEPRGGIRGYLDQLNKTPGRRAKIQRYFTMHWLAILTVSVAYVLFRGRSERREIPGSSSKTPISPGSVSPS
ncbi:MAG: hypothetical protein R2848_17740 [Thermomicrobiales bacterium]